MRGYAINLGQQPMLFDRREKIREDVEAMLDKIQASLLLDPSLVPLFTIRWEVT